MCIRDRDEEDSIDVEKAFTPVELIANEGIGVPDKEDPTTVIEAEIFSAKTTIDSPEINMTESSKFYSPLVKNIAKEEGIAINELETIRGTGDKNRVTKKDILDYIAKRTSNSPVKNTEKAPHETLIVSSSQDKVIEMTRIGKMISDHMVISRKTVSYTHLTLPTNREV